MKKRTYEASTFTVDELTGRLLLVYYEKKKEWSIPKCVVDDKIAQPTESLIQEIYQDTGYHVTFFKADCFQQNIVSPIAFETKHLKRQEVITMQYVTKVVGGIPVFHERPFVWLSIPEMVERNIDASIIQRARMLGCY